MSHDSCKNRSRMLILCFDGTADEFDDTNTNVVKLYSMLQKNNPEEQLTYYQAGIGTYFDPGVVSPLFSRVARVLDEATAWCLNSHVRDGYSFLMQNYREGDKISLFGFSRGAYTARALAGFLYKIGLLSRDNHQQIPFAYKLYARTDPSGVELARGYKNAFCRNVVIDFVGVWDTVASVGLLYPRTLPFTSANAGIKVFRHALALDERRAKFQPNLYHMEDPSAHCSRSRSHGRSARKGSADSMEEPVNTDVLEMWFAGCHADVGGGSVQDSEQESLSQITLRWMVEQAMSSGCGVLFKNRALLKTGIDPPNYEDIRGGNLENSREQQLMARDCCRPIYDQLAKCRLWWILECLPVKYTWQDRQGRWHAKWGFNLGKGRVIQKEQPIFHTSVKLRMENSSMKYTPKAQWTKGAEIYRDS